MIVGPGNLFVTLAKKFVFGQVAIDCLAGPERGRRAGGRHGGTRSTSAADLIAQAEHDPGSSVLITWHEPLLDAVERGAARADCQAAARRSGPRGAASSSAPWCWPRIPHRRSSGRTCSARSTCTLRRENADKLAEKIDNAGAIFLGHYTPVALGDYVAGPSHVLPTGGTARFASGLSANDFLRRSSVMSFTPEGLAAVADDVRVLANKEGLTAHAASVDIRLVTRPLRPKPAGESSSLRGIAQTCTPQARRLACGLDGHHDPISPAADPRHGRLHARRAAAGRGHRQAQHQRESLSAVAARSGRACAEFLHGDRLRKYPDPLGTAFRQAAGELFGVDPDGILIGNGSDDILTILTRAFVPEGGLVVSPTPSYLLYATLADIQGARFEAVPYTPDWQLPHPWPTAARAPDADRQSEFADRHDGAARGAGSAWRSELRRPAGDR